MRKFILIIGILLYAHNAQAQFLKKLGEKAKEVAERTLERKTEEKTEKTTEQAVDSIFEVPKKVTKTKKNKKKSIPINSELQTEEVESPTDDISLPGNMFSASNVSYEQSYVFPVTATIEVEDVTANLKKTTMKQGYGKEALITEMETSGDPIIIDMKNQAAIMLNINNGTAQVMSLQWMEKMMGNGEDIDNEEMTNIPEVIKTGNTKQMNGYTCHEYNISFENGTINAWYAPDVNFNYQDYLRGMSKMFSKKKEENPIQLLNSDYGYVMEMILYNTHGKKQNSMKVVGLLEKVKMINMELFTIQKL